MDTDEKDIILRWLRAELKSAEQRRDSGDADFDEYAVIAYLSDRIESMV